MNQRNSIVRRNLRAYGAALLSYVMLAGQFAPLALAAAPKPAAAPATPASAPAPAAPLSAAPMPAPMPFFAPGITATKVDSWDDTVIPNGQAEPGQTVTYTVTINNSGPDPATGVMFSDTVDSNTSLVAGSIQTQPVAQPDTITAFGNVRVSTANGAPNLLANDCDPDDTTGPCNDNLTASGPTSSAQGGNVVVNSDGTFSYNPAPGFTGADSFTYTVTDKGPDNTAGNADDKSDTATVSITVGPTLVWFINNDPSTLAGGDGRITSPFNSIAAYNASATPKDPGDIIFLYTGTGTYTGGFALANTQKVIGQGFSLATETGTPPAGSDPLPGAGAAPTINNPGANVITLAQNNTLRGFNTGNTGAAGTDIAGTSFGTLTVSALSINGDGRALNLTTGTLAATVANISASNTGSNTGLTLNGVGGVLTVSGTTDIQNPGGTGIDLTNLPSGANHNFGATIVNKNSTTGIGVNIATNNAGATTTFTTLTVTTGASFALQTNAGGTVNASGGSLTQSGAGGGAATLTNTALNLTFTSVSSNGGANGLLFSGGTGSFSSGTTNLQNNAGIGLSMSSSSVAANFGNTTVNSSAGDAVDLANNSGNITFADLDMTPDAPSRGLDATGNTGTLTVTSGDITTSGGGSASAVFIDGPAGGTPINITFTTVTTAGVGSASASISLADVSGTKFQMTGTTQVNTRSGTGVFVDNSTATTIQFATVNVPNASNAGGYGIRVEDSSSAVTVASAAISGANQVTAQADTNNDGVADTDGDGDAIFLKNNTGSFTLSGGSLTSSGGDAIDIRAATNVSVSNVTIDGVGLDVSGSSVGGVGGHGIYALNLTGTSAITNVTITNWETAATNGLRWWNQSGTGTLTIHGSTFSNSETGSGAIIYRADGTAVMTLNVGGTGGGQPCNFTNLVGEAIGHAAGNSTGSTGTANLTVQSNNFTNNLATKGQNSISARNVEGGKAIVVISGNTFDGVGRTAADTSGVIDIGADALNAGNFIHFTVTNNIIRNIGDNITNSCGSLPCTGKRGIDVFIDDNSVVGNDANAAVDADDTILIDGNVITNVQRNGIIFDTGSAYNGSNYAAKITNNRVGIRADNTIDRVGIGTALSAGGESGIRIENRNSNAKNLNILVQNNLVYNGNGAGGSSLNGSGIFFRAQNTATMSATVTGNTVNTNNSSTSNALRADTNFSASGTGTLCLDASGNSLNATGAHEISLNEIQGILNVEQANLAGLSAANGGAVAQVDNGTPQFNVPCSTPPAAPLFEETSGAATARAKAEIIESNQPKANAATAAPAPAAPAAAAPAPARVWSDMPVIITRTPRSDSAADEKSDDAEEKEKEAATSEDAEAAPKKARKPARTKKSAEQTEQQQPEAQPENRNISYLGPLGSTPAPKRMGGVSFRHTAADSSAPLNPAPEPVAQRRKASAPVLTDPPGGPNGSGGTVNVTIGTLAANDSVTITFQVTIDNPYSGGPNVSNQGTVSGSNFTSVQTDDPDQMGTNNPTLTPVNAVNISVNNAKAAEPASGSTDMVFTVVLSIPAPGAVSVNFTTNPDTGGANPATAGTDYVSTSGTVNFATGEQVKTINVPVLGEDGQSPENDETFLVDLSGAVGGTILDGQAVGTITQGEAPGTFLISELRTSGPNDEGNDFVEFYNATDTPHTVAASDGSAGYGIYKMGATCATSPVLIGTIPNGTVIPARGHFLARGSQYSLQNYGGTGAAAGNLTLSFDIETDRNVAVFSTANLVNVASTNRLDAVGFGTNTGQTCDLLREGSTLPPAAAVSTTEHTFFRKMCDFVPGSGCSTPGWPKDTNINSADFLFADTQATTGGPPQKLGAPGPENLSSPIRRDALAKISMSPLDGTKPSSAPPNRFRDSTSGDPNHSSFGTLLIRRRVTNNTGGNVTRLRFRIIEMTTVATLPGQADLRALDSADESVSGIGDTTTCAAETPSATPVCTVTVKGLTLEQPPAQGTLGGGLNSTLSAGSVSLGLPLQDGKSMNVVFKLGVQMTGTFRFLIIVEALP